MLYTDLLHDFNYLFQDGRVAVKSCEGLILCASLSEQASASCLVNNTNFCGEMIDKLCHLYEKLPKLIDPTDLETVEAKWGYVDFL
jgi:hypothetical protein